MGSREKIGNVMRFGRFMARFGYYFGEELAKVTLVPLGERIMGQPDTDALRAHDAEHKAAVGIEAVRYGRRIRQPEVELMGGAMAVKAAVQAEGDDNVPPEEVEGIVQAIVEADIDPPLNPLLPEEDARVIDELVCQEEPLATVSRLKQ